MEQLSNFSKRHSPQQLKTAPSVKAVSFSGAGHDRVMTSALRGGVFGFLKYQLN